jgi:hypothetical protein
MNQGLLMCIIVVAVVFVDCNVLLPIISSSYSYALGTAQIMTMGSLSDLFQGEIPPSNLVFRTLFSDQDALPLNDVIQVFKGVAMKGRVTAWCDGKYPKREPG